MCLADMPGTEWITDTGKETHTCVVHQVVHPWYISGASVVHQWYIRGASVVHQCCISVASVVHQYMCCEHLLSSQMHISNAQTDLTNTTTKRGRLRM